ncbi:hypothetical protein PHYPSEUDO_011715 [Phytophthora pseudosyringae]|uniref:Calponin-homology (CH) domain-containing protein n=1 Tax=Phytophthora pseudosyringae TaxID=221518 RepID=A0A8T1W6D6_9STRA|nr:hypothetical protein PHYPSEUDO_011715 [Phytophthora pseudosyringae]
MDVNMNVLGPHHDNVSDVRESAMGGKHQRSLSLSAKWASDKALAIEYLRRQRDVMTWIESVLKRELPTTDLFEALKSGVVLREMMETLFPDVSNCMSPISRKYSKRMAPWKERENISVFLRQCKSVGMYDLSLFCTDDLYEGTNMVQVLFCVQHFRMFSEEHVGHLFKPVAKNEPAEFSNQELEMAMSKIEQAGVDAKALQGLIAVRSPATVSEKVAVLEKESTVRAPSEPASVPSKEEEKLESVKGEEPAENEEPYEKKRSAEVLPEVCNQVSEELQDVDNPADDDDVNPAQESGSDAGDDDEVIQEDNLAVDQETSGMTEILPVASPSTQGVETMAVIQQVLADMAAVIEESEAEDEAQTQGMPTVEVEPENASAEVTSIPEEVMAEPVAGLALEAKGEVIDEASIEMEVTEQAETPAGESADASAEATPVEEVANSQPSAEITEKETEQKEGDKPQRTEEQELEEMAMAKCTCCRCTVM